MSDNISMGNIRWPFSVSVTVPGFPILRQTYSINIRIEYGFFSNNKPLSKLFDVIYLLVIFCWFKILKRIFQHGFEETINRLPLRFCLFTIGCTLFLYLYVRNKLIAWHVLFSTILSSLFIALIETFIYHQETDMRKVLAGVILVIGTTIYMILRYRAYADHVRDMTNS
jgi:hypothetical protein